MTHIVTINPAPAIYRHYDPIIVTINPALFILALEPYVTQAICV
ncbi:hypothetical protein [Neobacillus niacini]|nr:hypothetical protein [Neobacillus niacini]